jgi:hypothetical protein
MSVIICAYIRICIWHYAYLDFRVLDFFRVEGYAFKCLRVCKFLLSQTLNGKKGCTFLCVCCHFYVQWWVLMELGVVARFFFCLCIPLRYAFMFLPILANLLSFGINFYKKTCPQLPLMWRKLWQWNSLLILLMPKFNDICFSMIASCKGVMLLFSSTPPTWTKLRRTWLSTLVWGIFLWLTTLESN